MGYYRYLIGSWYCNGAAYCLNGYFMINHYTFVISKQRKIVFIPNFTMCC